MIRKKLCSEDFYDKLNYYEIKWKNNDTLYFKSKNDLPACYEINKWCIDDEYQNYYNINIITDVLTLQYKWIINNKNQRNNDLPSYLQQYINKNIYKLNKNGTFTKVTPDRTICYKFRLHSVPYKYKGYSNFNYGCNKSGKITKANNFIRGICIKNLKKRICK